MKQTILTFLFVGLSLPAKAQGTFNQFNCNSYGDYSECHVPDGTKISCYNGAYSECRISHANGVSSDANGAGAAIISLIVTPIVERNARKSEKYLRRAANFNLQTFIILSDMASFFNRFAVSFSSSSDKQEAEKLNRDAQLFAEAARATYQFQPGDWRFYENRAVWKKLYKLALQAVCNARSAANAFTREMSARLPVTGTPDWIRPALDDIQHDAAALDADCTSKEAAKILKEELEKN